MPVDPSIALQAGQNIPQFGPDLGKIMTMRALAQRMQLQDQEFQQNQRQIQAQNALRQVYSNPANIDPNTNMLKPAALAQVYGVDPQAGMAYQKNAFAMHRQNTADQLAGLKVQEGAKQRLIDEFAPADATYMETLKTTGDPATAQRAAQQEHAKIKERVLGEGWLPESLHNIPPDFNHARYQANALGIKGVMDEQHKSLDETRKNIQESRGAIGEPKAVEVTASDGSKNRTTAVYNKDQRSWETPDGQKIQGNVEEVGTRGGAADKPAKPVEVEYTKPDGTVDTMLAQQMPNGQWATADEKHGPVPGTVNRIVKEGQAGGREATLIQRQLIDAKDAVSEIKNIAELPVGASSGWLGGYHPGTSLMGATNAVLGRKVTSQEVQDYNTSAVGLGRALAGLETGGLQVNQGLMSAFEKLQLNEGDSQLTKARKLASMRQQAENALEAALVNPRMGQKQHDFAEEMLKNLRGAIPWTPHDVTMLEYSKNPQDTLGDYAKSKGLGTSQATGGAAAAKEPAATAPTPGAAPTADDFKKSGKKYLTNPQTGESYELRDDGSVAKVR